MPYEKNREPETIRVAWYENNIETIEPIVYFLERSNFKEKKISAHEKDENNSLKDTPKRIVNKFASFKPDIIIFNYRKPCFTRLEIYMKLENLKNQKEINTSFVPTFLTICENDEMTLNALGEVGISKQAIYNKKVALEFFAKRVLRYYLECIKKRRH